MGEKSTYPQELPRLKIQNLNNFYQNLDVIVQLDLFYCLQAKNPVLVVAGRLFLSRTGSELFC